MDDPENTKSSSSDMPDEAQSDLSADAPRQVLEGDILGPRKQPDAPLRQDEESVTNEARGSGPTPPNDEARQREAVERGLAQYVFVREEREREVRLTFRDASAGDIAHTFRSAGAHLITFSAERAYGKGEHIVTQTAHGSAPDQVAAEDTVVDEPVVTPDVADNNEEDEPPIRRRAARQHSRKAGPPTGEVLLRYFYALGEVVYTVSIVSLTGAVTSIASMYPVAARSERELSERLSIVFV